MNGEEEGVLEGIYIYSNMILPGSSAMSYYMNFMWYEIVHSEVKIIYVFLSKSPPSLSKIFKVEKYLSKCVMWDKTNKNDKAGRIDSLVKSSYLLSPKLIQKQKTKIGS